MTWTWHITSGCIEADSGAIEGAGYSGKGEWKNLPTAQALKDCGPIVEGFYTIEAPIYSPTHGPFAMHLTPDPANDMLGRSAFMIHGDSVLEAGSASQGCIILDRATREKIWQSGDRVLRVVA